VTGRPPRGWPLRRYMALFVAALLIVAVCAGVFVRIQAEQDARQSAGDDTANAARHAATQVNAGFNIIQTATKPLLNDAAAAQLFSAGCRLNFAPVGAFDTGHIDVVRSDGSVECSSLKASVGTKPVYAGQSWMDASTPIVVAPVIDPRNGNEVVVVAYPFAGRGVLAWFLDLAPVGPKLLSEFGSGVHQLEFVVTSGDGKLVVARSINPAAWVGKSTEGTAFAVSANATTRQDLSGTSRIYSEAAAGVAGWRVYVGADEAAAVAGADVLANQGMAIILGGVAVMLVLTFVMHRRVAEPVRRLTERVRRASAGGDFQLNAVVGAAEVATLSAEFDALMASVNTELAARLKGELAAQVSERNYRTLFAGHPQPMWLYDTSSLQFLEVNDAAIDAYGYTRDEFMHMTVAEIRPAEDVPKFRELIADTPAYDRSGPWRHLCKDGTVLQVLITSHSLTFDGRAARFVMAENLTEIQKLEVELHQARARVDASAELSRMKDDLVSMVSHELRTPLASVVGFAELLTTRPVSDEQRQEYLAVMLQEGRRLTALINDFLDLQRIEAGREPIKLSPTDLGAVIERAVKHAGPEASSPIEVKLCDPLPLAMVDSDSIHRVLGNLISNARKYSPGGGGIEIGTAVVSGMIEVYVQDHGLGIPRESLGKLSEKFYRVDTSDRRQIKGTGLGLAISKRIVEAHGGAVAIRSDGPGQGSMVMFTVPIAPEVAKSGDVLVVEDDAGFAHLLEAEFAAKGLSVVWASDAETAEDLWREGKARAIVMDLLLPGVQGEDFLARLRAVHGPRVPVVVVTMKTLEAPEMLALQRSGVTAILRKGAGTAQAAAEMIAQALVAEAVA
jgi:PAS domain S-box-containing protein